MKEPFDYSIVPYTFGLCAAEECPRARLVCGISP